MSKIIDFEEILNKKLQEETEELLPEYEKDEYDDLLSVREITKLMDLSYKLLEKYNDVFEGIFKDVSRDMEEYKEFTKKLIQNYVEYKYPYQLLVPTNDLIDELLENFTRHKLEKSDKAIEDLKKEYGIE